MKQLDISQDLDFELEELIGKCIGILGIRGSGKSNTAGVIFEELLKYNYPLTVVDIDGEYFGLKEEYELLVIGEGENVDLQIEPADAAQVAEVSLQQSIPVVLDLSSYLKSDQRTMLKNYFTRLWNLAGKLRKPYMIGIEESHEYIPQGKKGELKEIINRIALRGRKRGLGAVVISQRSAKVEKDVLTQAGMLFLHRVVHEADMKVYNDLLPWSKSKVREKVSQLETGECIFLDEKSAQQAYIRERETFHAGFTPTLDTVETPQLKQVGESIVEAIEQAKKEGRQKKSKIEKMEEKIDSLQSQLTEKKETIKDLKDTARTLGYIQIDLDHPSPPQVQKVSKAIIESLEIAEVIKDGQAAEAQEAISDALQGEAREEEEDTNTNMSTEKSMTNAESGSVEATEETDNSTQPRIDREPKNTKVETNTTFSYPNQKDAGTNKKSSPSAESDKESASEFDQLPQPIISKVSKITNRIQRLNAIKKQITSFLVQHRPRSYAIEQISAWLDLPVGLILSNRPNELVEMGLIKREGKAKGVHYRCTLKKFVEGRFEVYEPDIDSNDRHIILSKLKQELTELGNTKEPGQTPPDNYIQITGADGRSAIDHDSNGSRGDVAISSSG